MRRVFNPFSLAAAFLLCGSHIAFATTYIKAAGDTLGPPDPRHWHSRLRYAHMVIECTVASTAHRVVTQAQLHGGSSQRETGIRVARLSDVVVLRGTLAPTEIWLGSGLENDLAGHRALLCCYWVPGLRMYAAVFGDQGYVKLGHEWVKLGQAVGGPEITIASDELEALIIATQPLEVARKADLIAIGRVAAASDSAIPGGDTPFRVEKIVIETEKVLKGIADHEVEFLVSRKFPGTGWSTRTPTKFQPGETWIVFLAHNDEGFYYPIAGLNGLLLVHGQDLIYDRAVKYPYSLLSLKRVVALSAKQH